MHHTEVNKQALEDFLKNHNVEGKTCFVRVDFNVPLSKDGKREITDDTRILKSIPCITLLRQSNAKVVLCSHLGQPKGYDPELTMDPVAERLSKLTGFHVPKSSSCIGESVRASIARMKNGDVLLLENIRFDEREEKNDESFIQELFDSIRPDFYVNEAFGTAHRAHASTVGITTKCIDNLAGPLMLTELHYLYQAIDTPKRPFTAVIGGAKVSTKLPILRSLLDKCDCLLIGGGMMFTFIKALGHSVGKSLCEDDQVSLAQSLIVQAQQKKVKLIIPTDTIITDSIKSPTNVRSCSVLSIPSDAIGVDIGSESIQLFCNEIKQSSTIVWNGPMGIFEMDAFAHGTKEIAECIAQQFNQKVITVVGGGDTVSAVNKFGLSDRFTHISTGGGASLEVLEGKLLPGVAALSNAL